MAIIKTVNKRMFMVLLSRRRSGGINPSAAVKARRLKNGS
jgi:hypothetical protein